jgi:hypothetical protein
MKSKRILSATIPVVDFAHLSQLTDQSLLNYFAIVRRSGRLRRWKCDACRIERTGDAIVLCLMKGDPPREVGVVTFVPIGASADLV